MWARRDVFLLPARLIVRNLRVIRMYPDLAGRFPFGLKK